MIVGSIVGVIALTGFISDHIPVRNLALADARKVVSITADGGSRIVSTDASTVGQVLDRANVKLDSHDLVEPGVNTPLPSGFFNINVYRAEPYRIVDGTHVVLTSSGRRSLRLVAADAGLKLYDEDTISVSQVQDFASNAVVGQQIMIDRATPVTVVADGGVKVLRSHATTVAGLLVEKAVKLGAKDKVTPAPTTPVVNGLKINITRVADADVSVLEPLPFSTKTVSDPNSPKGTVTIQVAGASGHRQVAYRIHYENGAEVSRVTLGVSGQVEPTTEVRLVGTKVQFAGSIEYWRPFVAAAAARWGVDPNLMLAIMKCESGGNANASNGSHFGLYQYSTSTWQSYGNSMNTIYDGSVQIDVTAGRLAQPGPTAPWLASKSCWGSYQ